MAEAGSEQLSALARASGTDWALGVAASRRALLCEGAPADQLHREAIERLGGTRVRVELARAQLLYGEWLRREGRRVDARAQLRTAYESLTAWGSRRSPTGRGTSCWPPGRRCASARWRPRVS